MKRSRSRTLLAVVSATLALSAFDAVHLRVAAVARRGPRTVTRAGISGKFAVLSRKILIGREAGISVQTMDLSATGDLLAVGGIALSPPDWKPPHAISEWQAVLSLLRAPELSEVSDARLQGSSFVHKLRLSPEGQFLAVSLDRERAVWPVLEVFGVPSMRQEARFEGDWRGFEFISEEALAVATGEPSAPLKIWDFKSGRIVGQAPPLTDVPRGRELLAVDGRAGLAALSWEESIQVWNVPALEPVARLRHEADSEVNDPGDLSVIPEGETFVLTGYEEIQALEFSPDGRWLASVRNEFASTIRGGKYGIAEDFSQRAHIKLWNPRTWSLAKSFEYEGPLWAIDFSPDGSWIAAASTKTVRILDTTDGSELLTLFPRIEGNIDGVTGVRVSPAGNEILATSGDGVVHVWKIQPHDD